jgi:hypothetical protein
MTDPADVLTDVPVCIRCGEPATHRSDDDEPLCELCRGCDT